MVLCPRRVPSMTGCWRVVNYAGLNYFLHLWPMPDMFDLLWTLKIYQGKMYSFWCVVHLELRLIVIQLWYVSSIIPLSFQTMPLPLVLQPIFCQEEAIIANKTTSLALCLSCQRKFIELPVCCPCGCPESCTIARHKSKWKMWNRWREREETRDRQVETRKTADLLCGLCAEEQLPIFR